MSRIDPDQFTEIVDELYRSIYRIALYMLRDEHEAEDVVQESFERLWRERRKVDRRPAATWLKRTAFNLCVDLLRRNKPELMANRPTSSPPPRPISPRRSQRSGGKRGWLKERKRWC